MRNAVDIGVPVIDLNFGCPARGALKGCAGAAALKDPTGMVETVKAAVRGAEGRVPVTAKIRAGFDHANDVEALARAAEDGGAALLTIHCRTRREGYCDEVDWTRIQRAVNAVSIPVAGNGSAIVHADLERMRRETGCAFVMVGRGALADPWMFSGREVDAQEAAGFLVEYADVLASLGANVNGRRRPGEAAAQLLDRGRDDRGRGGARDLASREGPGATPGSRPRARCALTALESRLAGGQGGAMRTVLLSLLGFVAAALVGLAAREQFSRGPSRRRSRRCEGPPRSDSRPAGSTSTSFERTPPRSS